MKFTKIGNKLVGNQFIGKNINLLVVNYNIINTLFESMESNLVGITTL